jgi:hypothetical protein
MWQETDVSNLATSMFRVKMEKAEDHNLNIPRRKKSHIAYVSISLYHVHEVSALWRGLVCASVRLHVLSPELFNRYR